MPALKDTAHYNPDLSAVTIPANQFDFVESRDTFTMSLTLKRCIAKGDRLVVYRGKDLDSPGNYANLEASVLSATLIDAQESGQNSVLVSLKTIRD